MVVRLRSQKAAVVSQQLHRMGVRVETIARPVPTAKVKVPDTADPGWGRGSDKYQ